MIIYIYIYIDRERELESILIKYTVMYMPNQVFQKSARKSEVSHRVSHHPTEIPGHDAGLRV